MYIRPNRHVLIDKTLVLGTAAYAAPQSANKSLGGLEPRPADRYAYGHTILYELDFTATPAGGAADCPPETLVQVLKSVFLSYGGGIQRRNNLSGLNIVRLSQQCDENLGPDVVDSYLPIVALVAGGGPQAVHLCIVDPLGVQWPKRKRGRKTGLIPLSALAEGADFKVTCIGVAAIMAGWTIADIDLKVTLLTTESDEPLEHVEVHEEFQDYSTSEALLPGLGDRLYSCILVTDDEDADFTQPTAFSMTVDGATILSQRKGDDLVVEEDIGRQVGINDVFPVVCPIVTPTGRDLDEMLPVRNKIKLNDVNGAHAGNYGVLVRYSKKLPRNTQRKLQLEHGVPAALVDRFLDKMEAAGAQENIGRVTVAMRAS